mgnify:CR=1 FL=1
MHTVGKVLSAIGGIIVIVCVLIFGFAVGDVSEKSADVNYVISGENNGIVTVFDDDNLGDWGFTIFIEGTYSDDNGNGVWDHCDPYEQNESQTDFTTTHTDDSENSFWYACDSEDEWNKETREEGSKTLVQIGDSASFTPMVPLQ